MVSTGTEKNLKLVLGQSSVFGIESWGTQVSASTSPGSPREPHIFLPPFVLQLVQAFTHAPAMLEADKGGKFHLVDGNVSGEFTDLVSSC